MKAIPGESTTEARRRQIVDFIYEDTSKALSFDQFSSVTDQTLHNDARWFRENGYSIVTENRTFVYDVLWADSYTTRSRSHAKLKLEIGKCTANLLINGRLDATSQELSPQLQSALYELSMKPQRVIALDAGSTSAEVASELCRMKIPTRNLNLLRLVTNSPYIAKVFTRTSSSGHRVTIIGGNLRVQTDSVCGTLAIRSLEALMVKADASIIGATSFDLKNGFSCNNEDEAEIKSHMLSMGRLRCVAIDSSKFVESSKAAAWSFAPVSLKSVDIILTDSGYISKVANADGGSPHFEAIDDCLRRAGIFVACEESIH